MKSSDPASNRGSAEGKGGAGFDTILGLSTTKPPKKLPAKLNQLARLTMNHLAAASENSDRSSVVTGNNRCGSVHRVLERSVSEEWN